MGHGNVSFFPPITKFLRVKGKTIMQNEHENFDKEIIVATSAIAGFFGVSSKTIAAWVADGMPKKSYGKFNLFEAFVWWQENINKPNSDKEEKARERYWQAKADREELAVAELKNAVIKKSELYPLWTARVQEVVRGLESQERIFPVILVGKTGDEISEIVADYNRKLRENYARDGKYTPVEEYEAMAKQKKQKRGRMRK